ncbi:hypothetical protein GIB67_007777 [Kingdonia uniflora]|uniref:PRA1 family protein n=1 Tax=Kingdonia uniflora TaxID=39325 RepID=A0A7J7N1Y0_9MAGN|nr:hypothetical protein GIB67_007777 [Kingdonia uniflora]
MDWGNVRARDIIEALRHEVDWSSPPRPLKEFFFKFTIPKSQSKWNSRLKCNLYYYRANYFIMVVCILGIGFLRRPLSIVAAILTTLTIALLNDSFAVTFSAKVTRIIKQYFPHLAAGMKPPTTVSFIRRRPSAKRAIHVFGKPRGSIVLLFSAGSSILWFASSGLLIVLWAFVIGLLATVLHASFRTPNLKARLNTFREEFRSVWRSCSGGPASRTAKFALDCTTTVNDRCVLRKSDPLYSSDVPFSSSATEFPIQDAVAAHTVLALSKLIAYVFDRRWRVKLGEKGDGVVLKLGAWFGHSLGIHDIGWTCLLLPQY